MSDKNRILIENLPDAYAYHQLITDSEGTPVDYLFLHINTAFTEMTGLPRDRVLNKKVTEVLPGIKEAAFDWIGTYGKVALSGETVRFEQYSEPLNRWYEVTAFSDAPGYFAAIFRTKTGFVRNIAERKHNEEQPGGIAQLPQRKQAEEALRAERDLSRRYLDTVETIIVSLDASGNVSMLNRYGLELLGYKAEQIIGKNWFATVLPHPEGMERVYPVFRQIMKGEVDSARYFENEVLTAAGKRRPIAWHNQCLRNVEGRIFGTISTGIDITERKEIEEALRESEQEKTLILNNANEIIAFHDRELRLNWANSAYLQGISEITGLTATLDSLKGKKCYEAWGLAKQCNGCPVSLAMQSGQPQEKEMTPQNQKHWPATQGAWLMRAAPARNSAGIIVGAIEIAHNITERKKTENALRESEQQLARELENAELMQDLSTQLIQAENVEALYDQILVTMLKILRSHFATIQQFHPERGTEGELYLLRDYGFSGFDTGSWEWITAQSKTSCGLASKTRQRVVFPDVLHCDFMAGSVVLEQYRQAGIRAVQSTPLLSRSGTLLGIITAHWREPHELTEREIRSLDLLARQAADLIELRQIQEALESKVIKRTAELALANKSLQQEIDERIHAQKSLEESEARYRLLVENANEAVIVAQNGAHVFCNPRALQLYGRQESEMKNLPIAEFIHPLDRDRVLQKHYDRESGKVTQERYSFRIITGEGSTKWVEASAVLIQWKDENASLLIISDITEAKKMEEEHLKADKLESIGLLAGGIAHDFNNYLATLLANITLAKLYKTDVRKMLDKLENMEKITLHAKDLSNQLFTFAKGGAPLKKDICVKELIVNHIKFALSGTNILPDFNIAADLHMVEADEGQISQVLSNIAINAVQAMPEGGVLEVTAENVYLEAEGNHSFVPLAEGPYPKIMIKDEGTGIPEKYLKKIFDPFFTTKDKGRGLGLATSYSIIKKHGGHIGVESEMGVGTSFTIFLPAIAGAEKTQSADEDVLQGTGKILIMDDGEDLLSVMGESLSALGYDVTLSQDGEQALELYTRALEQDQPFNLVILDLTIPGGMGGKQTIRELRKLDPGVKAIVASGYSSDPVMATYSDYGFKGIIKKPFTIEELSKTVSKVIR